MTIEGTVTRTVNGREVKIPFLINDDGSWHQWGGHPTEVLGANTELLDALAATAAPFIYDDEEAENDD